MEFSNDRKENHIKLNTVDILKNVPPSDPLPLAAALHSTLLQRAKIRQELLAAERHALHSADIFSFETDLEHRWKRVRELRLKRLHKEEQELMESKYKRQREEELKNREEEEHARIHYLQLYQERKRVERDIALQNELVYIPSYTYIPSPFSPVALPAVSFIPTFISHNPSSSPSTSPSSVPPKLIPSEPKLSTQSPLQFNKEEVQTVSPYVSAVEHEKTNGDIQKRSLTDKAKPEHNVDNNNNNNTPELHKEKKSQQEQKD